jgi:4-amino-4-deoxy-L-arabinose transferase-like glycosyltransferase
VRASEVRRKAYFALVVDDARGEPTSAVAEDPAAGRKDARPAPRAFPVAAFTVALGLRALTVAFAPVAPAWDGVIYARAAEQIARGEGYTQRSLDERAPARATAFYPVGFPAVLAALRVTGLGARLDLWLQAFAGAALVPLGWALGRRAAGARAGHLAAWVLALWPGGVLLSLAYLAEPLFALGAALALSPMLYARRRRRVVALMFTATGLGVVAYLRPVALPIAAFTALGVVALRARPAWTRGRVARARAVVAGCAVLAPAAALVIAPLLPWAVRNARLLGAPVLVSTNGGANLLLGTYGRGGYGAIPAADDCPNGMREVERDQCRHARARARIAADPVAWFARGALKVLDTFGHESSPAHYLGEALRLPRNAAARVVPPTLALCRVWWLGVLACALAGAVALSRRRAGVAHVVIFAPVLALGALHFVYIGGDRYHAAVMPMIAALAGVGLAGWTRRRSSSRARRVSGRVLRLPPRDGRDSAPPMDATRSPAARRFGGLDPARGEERRLIRPA